MSDRQTAHWELDALAGHFGITPRNPHEALDAFIARVLAGLRERNILHAIEDTVHSIIFAIHEVQQPAGA